MKILAALLLGGVMMAAAPAYAQDQNKDMSKGNMDMSHQDAAPEHHAMMHPRHRISYKRDYKTDQEEEAATRDLNAQYRGVNSSDVH